MNVKVAQMLRPFNKGFSALQIKLVMNDLVYRYTQNIKERIKIRVFKEKNDYFIYAKVPSESNDLYPSSQPIYYDVIIQLIPPNKASMAWDSVREYDAKVFSNIPSFVFTFNYVYHRHRALVNLTQGYYTQRALMERPRVRNPLNLLGIDKSLWYTIYHLDDKKLFRRANIETHVEDGLTLIGLLREEKVMSQDMKVDECERREKHKRDLKEAENKRKGRKAARDKAGKKKFYSRDAVNMLNDLSSSLKAEQSSSEILKNSLAATLNQRKGEEKKAPLKSGMKSGLSSGLNSQK
jgi:hypothetical protein